MKSKSKIPSPLLFQVFDVKPRKSDARKVKIMEAVIECVATKGLEETTFDAIGKMVKMERTHVNYYFANRKELIKTAVRYAIALGQEITIQHVRKANTWRERLTAVIEGPFEWLEVYPKHTSILALFYYLCSYDEEFHALQTMIQTGGEERLASSFQSLVESEKLSAAQATDLARTIQSLMAGNLHFYYSCEYPLSLKQLKAKTVQISLNLADAALTPQ